MAEWLTAASMAEDMGVPASLVASALRITGMLTAGRAHARGEGSAREYSPQAIGHVRVELEADGNAQRTR